MRDGPRAPARLPVSSGGERGSSFALSEPPGNAAVVPGIEAALVDLERALCRDRAHAIVAAPPGPEGAILLRELEDRLVGSLHAARLSDPSVGENELCSRILEALDGEGGPDAEARLLGLARELATRGSALVILIAEAGSMQAVTLRRLGRLAEAARPGLRLALSVAVEAWTERDPVAEVVAALGVGAEKVVLYTPAVRATPSPLPRRVSPEAASRVPARPPAVPDRGVKLKPRKARRPRWSPHPAQAICVAARRAYRARAGHRPLAAGAALGIAVLLLVGQLLSGPTPPREVARVARPIAGPSEPVRPEVPAETPPAPPRAAAASAEEAAPDAVHPSVLPVAAVRPEEAPRVEAPAPVPKPRLRRIRVSLNARPWARIEVDGRDVGVTPLSGVRVTAGSHRFRAHLPDGRVIERTIRVDAHRDHISFP